MDVLREIDHLTARIAQLENADLTGTIRGRVNELEAAQVGNVRRLGALEKNCHEPQEIEPRVIRALLKFGLLTKLPDGDIWWTGMQLAVRNDLAPLIEAQIDVADDAPSQPASTSDLACAEVYAGHALDALGAKYGVGRDPELSDSQFRPHVIDAMRKAQVVPRWQHQADRRIRGTDAAARQESLSDRADYGLADAEFPDKPPAHVDGLGQPFDLGRRERRGIRTVAPDDALPRRPSTLSAAEAGALTASLEYWRWLDKLMEVPMDPPPQVRAFLDAMELLVKARALEDQR